ncbi:alcohol dehydrogenase [Rhizoctonia solani]|nr:alcohol dehydrogenase [Rhizoctonia solani]
MCPSIKCSGFSAEGTFQQYIVSHATHVTPIPESLPLYSAAPILCAGLSVYGALKQSSTQPGDIVVVTGSGGGLGHLAIQYAINAFNLRVIAVDTGDNKKELCLNLGAEAFIDFKTSQDVVAEVKQAADGLGAHAVMVTSSAPNGYEGVLDYLRPRGTLLALGVDIGNVLNLDMITVVSRCLTIKGIVNGNRDYTRQALDIAARGRVHTTCRIEPLAKLPEVFEELRAGKLAGRVVLDLVSPIQLIFFID